MTTAFTAIPIKMTMSAKRFLDDAMGKSYRSADVASIYSNGGC